MSERWISPPSIPPSGGEERGSGPSGGEGKGVVPPSGGEGNGTVPSGGEGPERAGECLPVVAALLTVGPAEWAGLALLHELFQRERSGGLDVASLANRLGELTVAAEELEQAALRSQRAIQRCQINLQAIPSPRLPAGF